MNVQHLMCIKLGDVPLPHGSKRYACTYCRSVVWVTPEMAYLLPPGVMFINVCIDCSYERHMVPLENDFISQLPLHVQSRVLKIVERKKKEAN